MKRYITIITAVLLLLIPILSPIGVSNTGEKPTSEITRYGKGYRYNIQGWVYVHVEGNPYDRGYQQGYLLASEICDMITRWSYFGRDDVKVFQIFKADSPEKFWEICKSKTMSTFIKEYPEELKEEIRGIADGVKAREGKIFDRLIEFEDIMTLNEYQDCMWYHKHFFSQFHPFKNIFYAIRNLLIDPTKPSTEGFCSSFMATGDATTDGQIVVAHAIAPIPYFMERANIILDVIPTQGFRFVMTSPPGYIWSNENYYQNEKGIVISETTLSQGPWKRGGIPIAVRLRNAIQYCDSIDGVMDTLLEGNNGLYTCEYLVGDSKTGEISSIELPLYNTPIKKTKDGFFWSCNEPHDPRVKLETRGIIGNIFLSTSQNIFGVGSNLIAEEFIEVEETYYGDIDVEIAKEIMALTPICNLRADCKITDTELMESLGFYGNMGNPNGSQWNPSQEQKDKFPDVTILPASGYAKIIPFSYEIPDLPSNDKSKSKGRNSISVWEYEADEEGNTKYSSGVSDKDTIYMASSTGMICAFDKESGKKIWDKPIADQTVDPAISEDLLLIGSNKGIHVIDTDSGSKIRWGKMIGRVISKPVIADDLVIASTSNGEIYAFDKDTGNQKWTYAFDDEVYLSEVKDNLIFIGSGKSCYAFDVDKKEVKWSFNLNNLVSSPPKICNNVVYISSRDGNLYALYSNSGSLKWKYQTGWGIETLPEISDGTVYIGGLDNNFYALDEKTGELKWYYPCMAAIHSNPVAYGEYVFFGCDDGRFYALNKVTGELEWSFTPGYYLKEGDDDNYITTPILSNPVIDDGVVYFGAKGNVYALDAQTEEIPEEEKDREIDQNLIIAIILVAIIFLIIIGIYFKKNKSEGKKKK